MTCPAPVAEGEALLPLVLRAQQSAAEQLSAEHLRKAADRLVALAESLDLPLLLPVSPPAERLVGAAMLAGGGRIHAFAGSTYLTGARVLLVDAVVVQMAAVASAAYSIQRAGAEVVGAAVISLMGSDTSLDVNVFRLVQD